MLAHSLRQADRVVAFARTDIGHGHARFDRGEIHHLLRLALAVALVFGGKLVGTHFGHRAIGFGEGARGLRALGRIVRGTAPGERKRYAQDAKGC